MVQHLHCHQTKFLFSFIPVTPVRISRFRFLVLALLGVAILHGLVLQWVQEQTVEHNTLQRMAAPLMLHALKAVEVPAKPSPSAKVVRESVKPVTGDGETVGRFLLPNVVPQNQPLPTPMEAEVPLPPSLGTDEIQSLAPLPKLDGAIRDAEGWPLDTRLTYTLRGYYRGDLLGSGSVQWQHAQGRYQVEVNLRMALLFGLSLVSQGDVRDVGLVPQVYEERLVGRVRRVLLDGVVVKFADGTAIRQPTGVQDTASQFVELSRRFATGRQVLQVGTEVPVWLARPNALHLWTYDVVKQDLLRLPVFGEVPAFHLVPRPVANPAGNISAELWFAPGLQYLPVRIKINLGEGNFVDLLVEKIEQGGVE